MRSPGSEWLDSWDQAYSNDYPDHWISACMTSNGMHNMLKRITTPVKRCLHPCYLKLSWIWKKICFWLYGTEIPNIGPCIQPHPTNWLVHPQTHTFICSTAGITEAAAMAEGLDGGILITGRQHSSMLPPWKAETHWIWREGGEGIIQSFHTNTIRRPNTNIQANTASLDALCNAISRQVWYNIFLPSPFHVFGCLLLYYLTGKTHCSLH